MFADNGDDVNVSSVHVANFDLLAECLNDWFDLRVWKLGNEALLTGPMLPPLVKAGFKGKDNEWDEGIDKPNPEVGWCWWWVENWGIGAEPLLPAAAAAPAKAAGEVILKLLSNKGFEISDVGDNDVEFGSKEAEAGEGKGEG